MKKTLLIYLILCLFLLASCDESVDDEGFSVGYERIVSEEPLPGFVFGVKSDINEFHSTDVSLKVGIGIPSSAFLSDKEYKVVIIIENFETKERESLMIINVDSFDQFFYESFNLSDGYQTIVYSYEEDIIFSKDLLYSYESSVGVLLIGYEVIYIGSEDEEIVHFSTFQRLDYEVREETVIITEKK